MKPPVVDIEKLRKQLPFQKLRPKGGKKIQIDWKAEWERFDAKNLFSFKLESIPKNKLTAMRTRREVILDGNQIATAVTAGTALHHFAHQGCQSAAVHRLFVNTGPNV